MAHKHRVRNHGTQTRIFFDADMRQVVVNPKVGNVPGEATATLHDSMVNTFTQAFKRGDTLEVLHNEEAERGHATLSTPREAQPAFPGAHDVPDAKPSDRSAQSAMDTAVSDDDDDMANMGDVVSEDRDESADGLSDAADTADAPDGAPPAEARGKPGKSRVRLKGK